MDNTILNFVKHCLTDDEFLSGGIPTKEKYYLKKLGWTEDCKECSQFYNAMYILYQLNRKRQ